MIIWFIIYYLVSIQLDIMDGIVQVGKIWDEPHEPH